MLCHGYFKINHEVWLDTGGESLDLEKFAVSDGMAESVLLGLCENAMVKSMEKTMNITDELQTKGRLALSRDEVLRWFADIFSLRLQLNSTFNTSDVYWDDAHIERINVAVQVALDVKERRQELNVSLDYITEVAELVRITLEERHSHRLEWGIIMLIVLEVLFEFIHLSERYML